MIENINLWTRKMPWLNILITGIASMSYTLQAWMYSRSQRTLLDEGNYLYKGFLFLTGRLVPFQEYGTWTNKMPLSFLVPGFFQKVFSPGLGVGRDYAFLQAVLIFLGAVVIGIRLGGKWGGAITAVLLAVNPAPLKIHSMALSQGVVSLLLVLTFLLVLGKKRPLWKILIGSFLAGLVPLARINLTPVFPLVIGYIFWEHGRRKGFFALAAGLVAFLGMHLLYWPGILALWGKWIPEGLFASVDLWKGRFGDTASLYQPNLSFPKRLMAFAQGVRFQIPLFLGVFASLVFWPKEWRQSEQKRISIFLLACFVILFLAHTYAALFMDYNIHAFFVYLCFFHVVGLFLVASTWQNWYFRLNLWQKILAGAGIAVFTLFVGYSISEQSSFFGKWVKGLLQRQALSVEQGEINIASWRWWEVIYARFGYDFSVIFRTTAIGIFFFLVVAIIALFLWISRSLLKKFVPDIKSNSYSYVLTFTFIFGTFLSPTKILGGGYDYYACTPRTIDQYENAVNLISGFVESGDRVFWIGKDTQAVLLGLEGEKNIQIYPQQLNSIHSFRIGGNRDELNKAGFWQKSQAQDWIEESDLLLFEQQAVAGWFEDTYQQLNLGNFEKVAESNNIGCTYSHRIYIYRRLSP